MNELSWGSPTNEVLRRRFGVEGTAQGGPVLTMGSDIFPTFDIGIDRMDSDVQHLAGYRLGGALASVTPTAGQAAAVLLANPTNSGTLITIDQILVRHNSAASEDVILSIGLVAPASPVGTASGVPRDSRRFGQGTTGRLLTYSNPASSGTNIQILFVPTGIAVEYSQKVVLAPGSFMMARLSTVTLALVASWSFRERTAMAWELSA